MDAGHKATAAIVGALVIILCLFGLMIGVSALMGYITYLLWGVIAVPMGAPQIPFWAAWLLWIVASILFGPHRVTAKTEKK